MAVGTVQVKGLDEILKNLNKQIRSIDGDITKGLILGMSLTKADSMKGTPVDTGNLRGSHYLVFSNGQVEQDTKFDTKDKSGQKVAAEHAGHVSTSLSDVRSKRGPTAEIGCTAFYAESVHENLEAGHVTGSSKFLEKAIRKNANQILSLIKRYAKR